MNTRCSVCGKPIVNNKYARKFCDECLKRFQADDLRSKRAKLAENFEPISRKCPNCGEIFQIFEWHMQVQKYCSYECRIASKSKKKSKSIAVGEDFKRNRIEYISAAAEIVGKTYGKFVADNYNNPNFDKEVLKILNDNNPNFIKRRINND